MALSNLNNMLSDDDVAQVNAIRNPPEYKPGYDGGDGGSFGDIFGDSGGFDDLGSGSDLFGSSDDLFSSSNGGGSGSGGGLDDFFSDSGGFNNNDFNNNGFNNNNGFLGLGNNNQLIQNQNNQPPANPTALDKLGDYSNEALASAGSILVEMVKSIGTRTADDFGTLSSNLIIVGGVFAILGCVFSIIGMFTGLKMLTFSALGSQIILSSALALGTGLMLLGTSAYVITESNQRSTPNMDELTNAFEDVDKTVEDSTDAYEGNLDATLDELFGSDELDDLLSDDDTDSLSKLLDEPDEPDELMEVDPLIFDDTKKAPKLDFSNQLSKIEPVGALNREKLFNTFESFLVENTPEFAVRTEIDPSSQDFLNYETVCFKALANILNVELSEVKSKLVKAYDTFFSIELRLKRVRKLNNVDQIASEIENYLKTDSTDLSVKATVTIEGDYYKIVVTKGESAIITFGDIFKQEYCKQFFLNTKNKLPIVTGIDELGKVILDDAKVFDTMLIAGKPRSGKSWYVLGILMMLMMFNTPEQVQFIIVDPKESNLFNTLSLMPHVCGLHNGKNILDILDDIIENEGARRKRILAENKCDDIWELWNKGVTLPVLYLVIDEYMTIINNLGESSKEMDAKIQVLISQLPSQGIRLLFVPHRATGVVNKTNRTMLQFTAAVKADVEDVKDTLGLKKWDRSLVNPGDIAVKSSSYPDPRYVRGAALTTSDEDNAKLILNIAKAFYKLGVEMPDMSSMTVASNRIESKVSQELGLSDRFYRYNSLDIEDDIKTYKNEEDNDDLRKSSKYSVDDFMKEFM